MGKLIVPPWDREGGSLATSSHPVGLPCSARVQWHLPLLLLRQGKSLVWKTALTSLGLRLARHVFVQLRKRCPFFSGQHSLAN